MLYENIKKLVEYGIQTGLTPECERIYTTNLLLELFQEDSYEDVEIDSSSIELEAVLEGLLDEAVKRGIIEDSIGFRDLFDTKIMNCLVPRPAQVQKTFAEKYEESPEIMLEIGRKRGCIISGGNIDEEKTARIILDEFKNGKLGKITIEKAENY